MPVDNKPDWGRWEDEDVPRYLVRLVSQVIWQAGVGIDLFGAALRDIFWELADRILDAAYPQQPVEIDLGMHGSPEDPT